MTNIVWREGRHIHRLLWHSYMASQIHICIACNKSTDSNCLEWTASGKQGGSRTRSNHVVKSLISGFFPLNLPQNTLRPISIVQWKMGVSPIFVSLGSFPLNHDYGRKSSVNTQNNFSSGELFIMIQVHPSDTGRDGTAPRMTPEVVKKLQELLHDLFFVIVFFFLIVLQGIVITVTNTIDLVLQTIFCMTSLPNSITSNIISRGRRQQSTRRQRCSRRQRQRQLRGSEVPRAGLGEEDFFC